MVVVPLLIAGAVNPATRMLMAGILLVGVIFWTAHRVSLRRAQGNRKTVSFSSADMWVLVCETDAASPALWQYLKTHGISLLLGVGYMAGSIYPPSMFPLLGVGGAAYLVGFKFRKRLARLDASRMERLYAAWCLRENPAALFRELTEST